MNKKFLIKIVSGLCAFNFINLPVFAAKPWTKKEDRIVMEFACQYDFSGYIPWRYILCILNNRTEEECSRRWKKHLREDVMNFKMFEDDRILEGVLEGESWRQIANVLDYKTEDQCEKRWQVIQEELNFDEEQEILLVNAVHAYESSYHSINWVKISRLMNDIKTPGQCKWRWENVTRDIVENFSHEEDQILIEAVNTYGENDWLGIKENLPYKSVEQCQERWHNVLKKNCEFSCFEDFVLKEKVEQFTFYGITNWKLVASYFKNKNERQCIDRWKILSEQNKKEEVDNNQFSIYSMTMLTGLK